MTKPERRKKDLDFITLHWAKGYGVTAIAKTTHKMHRKKTTLRSEISRVYQIIKRNNLVGKDLKNI